VISVEEARGRILEALPVVSAETVSVASAYGRVLATDVIARVSQPPADVSAMDGWAVRAADVATVPARLAPIGTAPAGTPFEGSVGPGQCVRIFTGGVVPAGADAIVIQEDADLVDGAVLVRQGVAAGRSVRRAGLDFAAGEVVLRAGRRLTARDVGLAAATGTPWLSVRRRPRIAILATGDEVVRPGDPIGPGQIVSANGPALAAFVRGAGGEPIDLGIAPDDRDALARLAASARGADMLVTTGGASVGDHDLVREALGDIGMALDFWKIAMRPGKPMIFGRLGDVPLLGLPGNPVSTMVCALLFLRPALDVLCGTAPVDPTDTALLGRDLPTNDRRLDHLRASLTRDPEGRLVATPFEVQDSSMMGILARSDCLVLRPAHAPPAARGSVVPILRFDVGPPAF
jgi:molybdopterin molybdotransferase